MGTVALREEALLRLLRRHSCSLSLSQRQARDASRDRTCGLDRAAEAAARVHQLSRPNLTPWSLRLVAMGVVVGLLATGWFWLAARRGLIVCDEFMMTPLFHWWVIGDHTYSPKSPCVRPWRRLARSANSP